MAEIKRVDPVQAAELLRQGYVYVDVRSEPEFEQGHPPGALNVPLLHLGPGGMQPNPDFVQVMEAAFGKSEKLLLGCRSGGRSLRAAELLARVGFETLVDLAPGWEGSRDPFGRSIPGWSKLGLPVETGRPEGQTYASVKQRTPK